jgi:Flp pilus assembly pilin Flp
MFGRLLFKSLQNNITNLIKLLGRPHSSLDGMRGQTTVEYLLAIGVIAVAMAAVLSSGVLFEALADLYNQLSTKIVRPYP